MSEESNTSGGKRSENQHAFDRTDSRSGDSGDCEPSDLRSVSDEEDLASDSDPDKGFGRWTLDLGLRKNWRSLCCLPTMAGANPDLPTLSRQDWEFLFRETLLFAHYQVQRLRWRGAHGGIMPDGYDPNSLASQHFLAFLP